VTASWNDRRSPNDSSLDCRLRDLDECLTRVFAADLDDHDERLLFRESLARRADHERRLRDVPFVWGHLYHGQLNKKAWFVSLVCAVLVIGLLIAGHGVSAPARTMSTASDPLEKPDLRLSIMTTTDLVPFWLAVENGYFKEAGFTFDGWKGVAHASSGAESVAKLTNHEVDIAYATYTPFIMAEHKGTADLRLVAAASSAGPGSCMVMTTPGSKIKRSKDLAGARVAVTARNTISDLMIMSALKSAGVDWTRIHWVETPFKDMAGKLAVGEVDAAFMTEPFLSQAKRTIGAIPVLDTALASTPTADLPTAGFGATADFVRKYPKTVAAFQRVMARATAEAKGDRSKVESLLRKTAEVDEDTAKSATLLTFQSALDTAAIQRVVDLMREFGMINERIDAARLIAPGPSGR